MNNCNESVLPKQTLIDSKCLYCTLKGVGHQDQEVISRLVYDLIFQIACLLEMFVEDMKVAILSVEHCFDCFH